MHTATQRESEMREPVEDRVKPTWLWAEEMIINATILIVVTKSWVKKKKKKKKMDEK